MSSPPKTKKPVKGGTKISTVPKISTVKGVTKSRLAPNTKKEAEIIKNIISHYMSDQLKEYLTNNHKLPTTYDELYRLAEKYSDFSRFKNISQPDLDRIKIKQYIAFEYYKIIAISQISLLSYKKSKSVKNLMLCDALDYITQYYGAGSSIISNINRTPLYIYYTYILYTYTNTNTNKKALEILRQLCSGAKEELLQLGITGINEELVPNDIQSLPFLKRYTIPREKDHEHNYNKAVKYIIAHSKTILDKNIILNFEHSP